MSARLFLRGALPAIADGDAVPSFCTIDNVEVPEVREQEKVGATSCEATYYGVCEKLVTQAQERCNRIYQTFGRCNLLETLAFQECRADTVGTSIAAFNEKFRCRTDGEESIASCALTYRCRCRHW